MATKFRGAAASPAVLYLLPLVSGKENITKVTPPQQTASLYHAAHHYRAFSAFCCSWANTESEARCLQPSSRIVVHLYTSKAGLPQSKAWFSPGWFSPFFSPQQSWISPSFLPAPNYFCTTVSLSTTGQFLENRKVSEAFSSIGASAECLFAPCKTGAQEMILLILCADGCSPMSQPSPEAASTPWLPPTKP